MDFRAFEGGAYQYKEFLRTRSFWEGASPLALQPVEDAGLTLSPCVVHHLWRQETFITSANAFAAALANWW